MSEGTPFERTYAANDLPRGDLRRTNLILTWAGVVALALVFFQTTKIVLLGLLGAAVIAAALRPLARRLPTGRWFSAVVVGALPVLVFAGLAFLLGWLLYDMVQKEASQWPELRQTINDMLATWGDRFGLGDALTVGALRDRILDVLTGGGSETISKTAGALGGFLVAVVLVLFGAIFLLGESRRRLGAKVGPVLSRGTVARLQEVGEHLEPRLRWWLIGLAISSTVTGGATWAGLAIIGLPFALPLAVLAAIAEIVPNIGPAFAFLVVTLVAATQSPSMIAKALVVWFVVQLIESYVLVPWVMKRAVSIPPLVTLFTVVLWGNVFGLAGLLLAIPIDLTIWAFARTFLSRDATTREPPGRLVEEPAGGSGG